MILTEFNLSSWPKKIRPRIGDALGLSITLLGLIAMSYPRDAPENASWSFALRELGEEILPYNADKYKPWVSVGSLIFVFGVAMSPFAQWLLSFRVTTWLGKISFPLYLLHGTFIRSLFAWVLFWGQNLGPSKYDENFERYPLPSSAWIAFSVIVLMIPLLLACHLWVRLIEPLFDRIIVWMENAMVRKDDSREGSQDVRRGGWLSRALATLRAIVIVIRQGGISDTLSRIGETASDEFETSGLLREESERGEYITIPLNTIESEEHDGHQTSTRLPSTPETPESSHLEKVEEIDAPLVLSNPSSSGLSS